jgi:hypothetical protein
MADIVFSFVILELEPKTSVLPKLIIGKT